MSQEPGPFSRALSLAAHEMRTPVTVVAGYLRMLLKEQAGPLTPAQRKMLGEAERSCGRLGQLVTEMSDLGKLEAGGLTLNRTELDLSALVAEVATAATEGSDRGVRVQVEAPAPVQVSADRTRLSAALTTLLYAVLRERGDPGVVVFACAAVASGDRTWAVVAAGEDAVARALIERAGAQPPPLEEWRGGLGLALPVGRRAIEALGGAVWAAPGSGREAGLALRLPGC